jgi:hypothetical protein
VAHPQHDAAIVHALEELLVARRPEHVDRRLPEAHRAGALIDPPHPRAACRLDHASHQRSVAGARGEPDLLRGQLVKHRDQPERVVGVRVREHHQIERVDAALAQVGQHEAPAGVRSVWNSAPIEQERVPGRGHDDRVALSDGQERHREPPPGRERGRRADTREREGGERSGQPHPPAPEREHQQAGPQRQRAEQPERGHRQRRPGERREEMRGSPEHLGQDACAPERRPSDSWQHQIDRRAPGAEQGERSTERQTDGVRDQPGEAQPMKGGGEHRRGGERRGEAAAARLQRGLPCAREAATPPAHRRRGSLDRNQLPQRRSEHDQREHRDRRELKRDVAHRGRLDRDHHQHRPGERVERIRSAPERQRAEHQARHQGRAHRRGLGAGERDVAPDQRDAERGGHPAGIEQARPPARAHQEPSSGPQQRQGERRDVQPAHAQDMREPARREVVPQRLRDRVLPALGQREEDRSRVGRRGMGRDVLREPSLPCEHPPGEPAWAGERNRCRRVDRRVRPQAVAKGLLRRVRLTGVLGRQERPQLRAHQHALTWDQRRLAAHVEAHRA